MTYQPPHFVNSNSMAQARILILDHDKRSLAYLKNRLKTLGHQIIATIDHTTEVETQILQKSPQIILLNAQAEQVEETCQTIKELNVFARPVIVALNQQDRNSIETLPELPPCELITKPVIDEEIQAIIKFVQYRHQTQIEIQEQEQQIQAILHSTGDGLITFDKNYKILHMNTIAEMLTGWSQDRAFGQKIAEVVQFVNRGDQAPIVIAELINQRLKTGPLADFEITLINQEGKSIPVRANVSPMRNHLGDMEGGVIAFGNISELTRAIEQIRLHSQRADILLDIIAKLNSKLDLDDVLLALLQETTSIMEADGAVVVLLDKEVDTYQVVATHSKSDQLHKYKGLKFTGSDNEEADLFDPQHPIQVFYDLQNPVLRPYQDLLVKERINMLALAELHDGKQILGAMFILHYQKMHKYTEDELTFLRGLADQASLAIINARLFENVRNSRFRLQYLSKRLVEIQEAERRSMARELHDQIGQMLTGLQFSLEFGKRKADGDAKVAFQDAQEIVGDLIKQVRELSLKLLPSMLEDMGLLPTLEWYFEQFTHQTGIQVNFSQSGLEEKRFTQTIEITAYRIAQEGLTNAARHAQVNQVDIQITANETILKLRISDQGKGFDPERTVISRKTFGLVGMRERTTLAGGKFEIISATGKGTQLEVQLPLGNPIERRKHER